MSIQVCSRRFPTLLCVTLISCYLTACNRRPNPQRPSYQELQQQLQEHKDALQHERDRRQQLERNQFIAWLVAASVGGTAILSLLRRGRSMSSRPQSTPPLKPDHSKHGFGANGHNSSPTPDASSNTASLAGKLFLLDGQNIARMMDKCFRLEIPLTACLEICRRGGAAIIYWDNSTKYVARKDPLCDAAFRRLNNELRSIVCRAEGKADLEILSKAHSTGAHIVSNDQFRGERMDYYSVYPWMKDLNRFHRGVVYESGLFIGSLGIDVPLITDLDAAINELAQLSKPQIGEVASRK